MKEHLEETKQKLKKEDEMHRKFKDANKQENRNTLTAPQKKN